VIFTTITQAYAIPNQEPSTLAEVLITNFFCRFGIPRGFHSDQSRNFKFRLMQDILQSLGVSNTRISLLHPQSEGVVERYTEVVEEHLREVVVS
jgi:hypothetical protein